MTDLINSQGSRKESIVCRLSSAHQQKSREKVGIKIWKKWGLLGFSKYKIHYNELFETRNFILNEQDNTCVNSTS